MAQAVDVSESGMFTRAVPVAVPARFMRRKVLMMHGWSQNAEVFYGKTHAWRRKLKAFDLVYAQAPHVIVPRASSELPAGLAPSAVAVDDTIALSPTSETPSATAVKDDEASDEVSPFRENARAWYHNHPTDPVEKSGVFDRFHGRRFYGWDESRKYLADLWAKEGPFDAICGFSQGAVALHQLLYELEQGDAEMLAEIAPIAAAPPTCAIFVCGFPSGCVPVEYYIRTPSLHVIASNDACVPTARQYELLDSCDTSSRASFTTDKGHCMPQKSADMQSIAAFLATHIKMS
jgi:hypothetical protein